jgi:hypothetical protein
MRAQCYIIHSDYRTVGHNWVLPVYIELILAVLGDDGDRPLKKNNCGNFDRRP